MQVIRQSATVFATVMSGLITVSSLIAQESAAPFNSSAAGDTPAMRRVYENAALTQSGDPRIGRQLFFSEERTKCSVCHRVQDQGGTVGPELTQIGGKFDRPHLIESLLEPSRQIVEGFRTTTVRTIDGQVVSGIAKHRSSKSLSLQDASGKSIQVALAHIQEERTSDLSIMPAGIASSLTTAEFTDLIAYLETLRSGVMKMGAGVSGPAKLPPGFEIRTVATGLTGAVAMEVAPDGRVFVCEQPGTLRVVRDGKLLAEPFVTLPVQMEWERGLIGVTVDPQFPSQPYVYVCYVAKEPHIHHAVSRFTASGDVAVPNSEQVLLQGDDQKYLGGKKPAGHQGGALHFGPDGSLYIGIGEQTAETPAQSLATFQGKLLRIRADGTIPADNPLNDKTNGKYQAIWAYGLRNPFTFAIQQSTGDILINDVGGVKEEINRGVAGANYGWPTIDHGPTDDPRFVGPIHTYPQASISGSDFIPDNSRWPAPYRGKYFFADFVHGWIRFIDPKIADARGANRADTFAEGLRRPVDVRFARDGRMYVLLRNAWVVDGKFEAGTSSLLSIQWRGP